jgi:DNA-binding protein YbaB
VNELGIPELTTEQIEALCSNAENAARKYILTKVPRKIVKKLDISVEAEGAKPLNLTVDVDLELKQQEKDILKELVDEAVKEALKASDEYLRNLKCQSQK